MDIKFYKNDNLKYTSRKRIRDISKYNSFSAKTYNSIKLNDLSETSIIVSKNDICDYVTIDNTRWFVTGYTYLNGEQVELYLQRDVIGEYGVKDFYGKIERGITDSILRNKKELNLNQIMKKRIPILQDVSKKSQRGNFEVDTETNNELWGILYFSKGEEEQVSVNIPEFYVPYEEYKNIEPGDYYFASEEFYQRYPIKIAIMFKGTSKIYAITANFEDNRIYFSSIVVLGSGLSNVDIVIESTLTFTEDRAYDIASDFAYKYYKLYLSKTNNLPDYFNTININDVDAITKSIVKIDDKFYNYKSETSSTETYANVDLTVQEIISLGTEYSVFSSVLDYNMQNVIHILRSTTFTSTTIKLTREEVEPSTVGDFVINIEANIIDEPFCIMAFPLFSTSISSLLDTSKKWNVEKTKQFQIFNNVIRALSGGSNPLLIDAQIIPYCPVLFQARNEFTVYKKDSKEVEYSTPMFTLTGSSFSFFNKINLFPLKDVKKEYITREYNIVSPDGTGRFTFNFYDYTNSIKNVEGNESINGHQLTFETKLCLKPFSIISSCNIVPENDSLNDILYGITYAGDLRGCSPSNNGFQASLASNSYQQYLRENSNYQQIFALQKEQLEKQHAVEKTNETASLVMNTLSASFMGAVGGAAIGQSGGKIGAGIGAATGAVAAGATVGAAMGVQLSQNEKLREYERYVQQANFDLQIGTIKNLPNQISRISSFNEIIIKNFYYCIEVYECTKFEKELVDKYIEKMSYSLGVVDYYEDYVRNGSFIRGNLLFSNLIPVLHNIAEKELLGGIYLYE